MLRVLRVNSWCMVVPFTMRWKAGVGSVLGQGIYTPIGPT